jgi:hypothetical protein
MQGEPTSPRVLAVNGEDPAIYQRFEAIGHPLPITSVRISTGPSGRWIDQPTDHLPTAAELAAICPACAQTPCACTDEATDLRLEAELFNPDLGDDLKPWGER